MWTSRRVGQSRLLMTAGVLLMLGATIVLGCETSPEDELMDGRQALAARQADAAEEHLQAAIEADSDLVEARRLMANVHMLRAEFEKAEAALDELWDELEFDTESDLDADQRRTRQLMNKQYTELYRQWAESIDIADDPETFEQVATTGLERNSRDSRLNALMVEYYRARADEYVEKNDRIEAAKMLEEIDDLHTFTDTRREARDQVHQLRLEAFRDEAMERFQAELRPDLMEAGAYDTESEIIKLTIEQPLDRRLDPDDEEAVDQARTMAVQTLIPTLSQFAVSLAGLEVERVDFSALDIPSLRIVDEEFRPGRYDMVVDLARSDLFEMAFHYAEYERLRPEDEPRPDVEPRVGRIAVEGDEIELDTEGLDEEEE